MKKDVQAGGGESDGDEQEGTEMRGGVLTAGGGEKVGSLLSGTGRHSGLTPVTHPGDGADKS